MCGENGTVSCQASSCSPGEACRVADGVLGCHPVSHGRCVATGDPHYFSFDGRRFKFQGACVYTLAKVFDQGEGRLVNFSVDTQNEKIRNSKVSVIKTLTVTVYNLTISIRRGERSRVIVSLQLVLPHFFFFERNVNFYSARIKLVVIFCNICMLSSFCINCSFEFYSTNID